MTRRPALDGHDPSPDDLAWQAFRYVAGELVGVEEVAFEQRLDHDQEAREAVAEAVALVDALTRAGTDREGAVRPRRVPVPVRRLALAALSAAAVLVLAVGLGFIPWRSRPRHDASAAVALTWSGLRHAQQQSPADPDTDPHDALIAWIEGPAPSADPVPETDADPDTEPADAAGPPAWLLEAASLRNIANAPGF
jgi:hypothetical protein